MTISSKLKPLYYIVFVCITVIVLLPLFFVLFASLKPASELAATSPLAIPNNF
ncbi:hypothetical protein [Paenibacillus pectinilyticus]|uniref:hypothetical protein n=1 Tax=Paenibacillus pectinilyticus TaxID=512399 RepID=UPI001428A067|nr:hypothetical protein [Paenibacillus pectinilyticus]